MHAWLNNMIPKILIDTNVLKFAATQKLRIVPVNKKTRNWYGKVTGFQVSRITTVNPNEKIRQKELRKEADLLAQIAELAKDGKIELLLHLESTFESMGLPEMNSQSGKLYRAPMTNADSPVPFGRTISSPHSTPSENAKDFLQNINDPRFKTIQKITGAYQGGTNYNLNQLRDAFYIWCAEHNKCDYLLTLDFKLTKMVSKCKHRTNVQVLKPSELLNALGISESKESIFSKTWQIIRNLFKP